MNDKKPDILNGLLLIGTFALAIVYSLRRMSDTDLWAHLKCGEYFFEKGEILQTHYFNSSWPDYPYLNHEWLFQAIIYRIHDYAGEVGLIIIQVLLVLVSFFVLYRIMRHYTDNVLLIVIIISLGILASSHRFSLRPQHFSYIFLMYFLFSLHMYQMGKRRYSYILPLVMVLWVNIHAESLWGIFVPGIFLITEFTKAIWAKESDKRYLYHFALIYVLIILASLINPFTYKTIIWPLIVMKEQFAGVEELLAPTSIKYAIFWIYFLIYVISSAMNIKRIDPTWLTLSIVYAVIAWTANRGIPHFVFVSAPFIIVNISEAIDKSHMKTKIKPFHSYIARVLLLMLIGFIIFSVVLSPLYLNKYDNYRYPEGAINFIEKNKVKGNIFNHHPWGSFIIWTSYPRLKPYIDGRFFFKKFYDEYYHILGVGIGWQKILSKYDISIILLPYSSSDQATLNDGLFSASDWHLVYWDDFSLLYIKDTTEDQYVVREYGNRLFSPDRQLYDYGPMSEETIKKANLIAEKNLVHARQSYKALISAANTSFLLGDNDKAVKRYEEALIYMDVQNAWIYYRLALSYRNLGNIKKTEEYLLKCLSLAPDFEEGKRLLKEVQFLRTR
jgi:hypothetical protein